jgi:4-hydroxybenzoate polyprenyltransferase
VRKKILIGLFTILCFDAQNQIFSKNKETCELDSSITITAEDPRDPYQHLKLCLALSRTPHGIVDLAAPATAALLCLGQFPSLLVVLLGLITAFAGYTAVYALNDLVDYRIDKQKVRRGGYGEADTYIDSVLIRHPLAKGRLSYTSGLLWACGWAAMAMVGAYLLNPVCLYLFITGMLLEAVYCKLLRITPLRSAINGIVKTIGSLAAVFAVNPSPAWYFLAILFCWLFLWEIGGQNIPNDWTDIEEDRQFKARTIPVTLGLHRAGLISLSGLVLTLFFHVFLLWASPSPFSGLVLFAAVAVNYWMLLQPALRLVDRPERQQAMVLFNRASYYPLATLILVLCNMVL